MTEIVDYCLAHGCKKREDCDKREKIFEYDRESPDYVKVSPDLNLCGYEKDENLISSRG